MGNNINKIVDFYREYFKDLNNATLTSDFFILILEFDILIRFNLKLNKNDLKTIIKNINN
jgi:hypothetical protein